MTSRARAAIDAAYETLRGEKNALYERIFEFGETGKPEGFNIDAELSAMREKFAAFNRKLIQKAEEDPEYVEAIWDKCFHTGNAGLIFWFDAFVYTLKIHTTEGAPDAHVKMVLFPFQEETVAWLRDHIEAQKPCMIFKSRDVGASWMLVCVFLWYWIHHENAHFLLGSYKEELVDSAAPKALFPKMDYAAEKLPVWMQPPNLTSKANRKKLTRVNEVTKCVVQGEATNENFGRAGRNLAVGFDEWAFWGVAEKAKRSAGRNARCLIYITTPNGMGNEAARMYRTMPKPDLKLLHWTLHPEWQEGRYLCAPGCKYHKNGGKPHSKRYDHIAEHEYGGNAKDVAQEMDIDLISSGGVSFEMDGVEKAKTFLEDNPPEYRYFKLEWERPENMPEDRRVPEDIDEFLHVASEWPVKAVELAGGPLRVLRMPFSCRDPECLCKGTGMHTYSLGGDTAKGLPHGDADCAYIRDVTTGETVAEWHGRLGPRKLGQEWAKLCKWYGTSSGGFTDAWAAVEWNESGKTVNEVMDLLGILLHKDKSTDKKQAKADYLGVNLTPYNRNSRLDKYLVPEVNTKDEAGYPRLICGYKEFWEECETFVSMIPEQTKQNPDRAKRAAPRGLHDDRVMAMLHTLYGAEERFGRMTGHVDEEYVVMAQRLSRSRTHPLAA